MVRQHNSFVVLSNLLNTLEDIIIDTYDDELIASAIPIRYTY